MLKPIPEPDADSRQFWEACKEKRFIVQRCTECLTPRYPPSHFCPHCRSTSTEWIESAGEGSIYSWIVVQHPIPRELYGDEVPYVVALIELNEGVRIASNIIGCDPEDIEASAPVKVVFEEAREGVVLPKFKLAGAAHGRA